MTIKTILVPLRGDVMDPRVLTVAGSLAQRFRAHLVALHIEPDPADLIASVMFDVGGGAYFTEELSRSLQGQADKRRDVVKAYFSEWRTAAGIPETAAPGEAANESTELVLRIGDEQTLIRDFALAADLMVLGLAAHGEADDNLALEIALLDAGRPVFALPQKMMPPSDDAPVVVAWNASAEAAHALSSALPLIRGATNVQVLHAGHPSNAGMLDTVASYLAWHGIQAQCEELGESDAPEVLIARKASEIGAGMLVMGAYTHSRAREFVFGGMTRDMLRSSQIPLLLAH